MKHLTVAVKFLIIIVLFGIINVALGQECDSWIKGNYQPNVHYRGFLCSDEGLIYQATAETNSGPTHLMCLDDQLNILHESSIDIINFDEMKFFSDGILVLSRDNGVVMYHFSKDLKLIKKWNLSLNSNSKCSIAVGSSVVYLGIDNLVLCYNYQFEKQWQQSLYNLYSFYAFTATTNDELYFFCDEELSGSLSYCYGKYSKTGVRKKIKVFYIDYNKSKDATYDWAVIDPDGNLYVSCYGFKGIENAMYAPLVKFKPNGTQTTLISYNYSYYDIYLDRFRNKIIVGYNDGRLSLPLWADITSDGDVTNHFGYPTSGDEVLFYADKIIATPKNLFIFGWANQVYLNIQKFYGCDFAMKLTNDYCFFPKDQNYGGDNQTLNCLQDVVIGLKDELAEIVNTPKKSFSELTYSWDSPSLGSGVQKTVKPNFTTEYNVTVSAKNCSIKDKVKVDVYRKTDFTYTVDSFEVRVTPIHSIDYNFIWDFGNGISNQINLTPTYTYSNSGTYSLCLADFSNTIVCHSCVDIKLPGNYSGSSVLQSGIPEEMQSPTIKIYPNPASGNNLTIDLGDYKEDFELKIFNITGQLIQSNFYKSQSSINVDISQFNKGLYLINFRSQGKEKSLKFVKF